jgi:hypothetical protein
MNIESRKKIMAIFWIMFIAGFLGIIAGFDLLFRGMISRNQSMLLLGFSVLTIVVSGTLHDHLSEKQEDVIETVPLPQVRLEN